MRNRMILLLSISSLVAGCYTSTITTGLPAGTKTIEKKWAASWIVGLVPPKAVDAAADCPDGVAKVVTQQSFPNMLVRALTLGIYSPTSIVVTCARGANASMPEQIPDFYLSKDACTDDFQNVFAQAARHAVENDRMTLVKIGE
jgi:hypothetical protein